MKVLVIGGTGIIGSFVTQVLLEEGYRVTVFLPRCGKKGVLVLMPGLGSCRGIGVTSCFWGTLLHRDMIV